MSRSAPLSFSESIQRIARGRRAQMGLERVPVDHVDRAVEQAGDKFFQADIFVDRPFGPGLEFHQNIDVAVGVVVAARDRTEHGRAADSARKAGSASFSLAMTSSRRMATSYQIQALHSSSGVLPRP